MANSPPTSRRTITTHKTQTPMAILAYPSTKPAVAMPFGWIFFCFAYITIATIAAGSPKKGNQQRTMLAIPSTRLAMPNPLEGSFAIVKRRRNDYINISRGEKKRKHIKNKGFTRSYAHRGPTTGQLQQPRLNSATSPFFL